MIRRPPRSTQSRSSAASDVYKRQNIDSRYSVDEIKKAVTRAWEGGRNGKVLIVPSSLE